MGLKKSYLNLKNKLLLGENHDGLLVWNCYHIDRNSNEDIHVPSY